MVFTESEATKQENKMAMFTVNRCVILVVIAISMAIALIRNPKIVKQDIQVSDFSMFLERDAGESGSLSFTDHGLQYDFYSNACPGVESIVRSAIADIYMNNRNITAGLLRLLFHDCFIEGCDASVFLDDSHGNKSHIIERQASPNLSLKGFDAIESIKERLESVCPGVVSCADTLALAVRDSINLAGGPFYPVFTGRRDSSQSYFLEAMNEIPTPSDYINRTLVLFASRGFNERETVSLLGGHNIGKIDCKFVENRLSNFSATSQPDPSMASDFIRETRLHCLDINGTILNGAFMSSGSGFDGHYYQRLLRGRGILFSDQQLMANEKTARVVRIYASDDGTTFRRDFARGMVKLSNLNVLTGNQGEVRNKCSVGSQPLLNNSRQ